MTSTRPDLTVPLAVTLVDHWRKRTPAPALVRMVDGRVLPASRVTFGMVKADLEVIRLRLDMYRAALDLFHELLADLTPHLDMDQPVAAQVSGLPPELQGHWPRLLNAMQVCDEHREFERVNGLELPDVDGEVTE